MLNFLNTFSVGVSKTLDSGDPAPTNFKMAYTWKKSTKWDDILRS